MTRRIGTFEVTGSEAWCDFVRFVVEDLGDWEIFLLPPRFFAEKYPQHGHMLEAL